MRPSVSYGILCNGDFPGNPDVRDRLLSCDVVVCCDGAAASFMRFRKPEFVVGDMDSLPEDVRQELADQLFPVGEQESNDLSKAPAGGLRGVSGGLWRPRRPDDDDRLRDVCAGAGLVPYGSA